LPATLDRSVEVHYDSHLGITSIMDEPRRGKGFRLKVSGFSLKVLLPRLIGGSLFPKTL